MPKKLPKKVQEIIEQSQNIVFDDKKTHISFSQFQLYNNCPFQWYLTYVTKQIPYTPSIHTVFGTAMHETIQLWLNKVYNRSVKKAMEIDLNQLLYSKLREVYVLEKEKNQNTDFTTPELLQEFYQDGVNLLEYLKRKRIDFFSTRGCYLVGDEIPIYLEIQPNTYFKGFIDLVLYDEKKDKYKLIDFKTSTSGWKDYAKKNEVKISQLILYKDFFSKQYKVDIDKIDIEYFILKRKLPHYSEDYNMKPIQLFKPPSGKIKRGRINTLLDNSLKNIFDGEGNYKEYIPNPYPSKTSCMFCPVKEKKNICNVGVF